MTTKQKTSIFTKGTHKILNAALPYSKRWRMLYNTMHRAEALCQYGPSPVLHNVLENISKILSLIPSKNLKKLATEIPNLEILYNFEKLSMLQKQRSERIKDIARMIMYNMINAIIENKHEITAMNYNNLNETQRIDFITTTLMTAHKNISQRIPEVSNALQKIVVNYQYNIKRQDTPARAYYRKTEQQIGLCLPLLADDNISSVIATMSHEYVHTLQSVYKSALPASIVKFSWKHIHSLHKLPHEQRTIEKEANRVTRIVQKNFDKRFYQAVFEPEKYAAVAKKFTTPPTHHGGRD